MYGRNGGEKGGGGPRRRAEGLGQDFCKTFFAGTIDNTASNERA